ncbi:MAG: DUF6250 domain-containing protein [Verrucomicrobiota bacterium]
MSSFRSSLPRGRWLLAGVGALLSVTACTETPPKTMIHSDDFSNDLSAWEVEQQPGGTVSIVDGQLVIADEGGGTVWFREKLAAPVVITYEVKASSEARVSDINCFWMASDPDHPEDLFAEGHGRTGAFATYDQLETYYVGFGGNYNTTTRFRRYTGDGKRPLIPEHDLSAEEDMITPDHVYQIRLVAAGGRAQYYRDGELVFDYADEEPLTEGWFGFRTVLSRLVIDHFAVWQLEPEAVAEVLAGEWEETERE